MTSNLETTAQFDREPKTRDELRCGSSFSSRGRESNGAGLARVLPKSVRMRAPRFGGPSRERISMLVGGPSPSGRAPAVAPAAAQVSWASGPAAEAVGLPVPDSGSAGRALQRLRLLQRPAGRQSNEHLEELRRQQHRHHIEPDVAGCDAAWRIAVGNPEPG
jgi:hypothetical protein